MPTVRAQDAPNGCLFAGRELTLVRWAFSPRMGRRTVATGGATRLFGVAEPVEGVDIVSLPRQGQRSRENAARSARNGSSAPPGREGRKTYSTGSTVRPCGRSAPPMATFRRPLRGEGEEPGAMARPSFALAMRVYRRGHVRRPTLTPALSPGRGGKELGAALPACRFSIGPASPSALPWHAIANRLSEILLTSPRALAACGPGKRE
jgi:hypothetical protein